MPNGGPDCCGTCWFNRSLEGEQGSMNFNRAIPSHCEIRGLDIPDPFYTYCANHPYQRPNRDPIPIGPIYIHVGSTLGGGHREVWQSSPDSEEIRRHLLDLVHLPGEHASQHIGALNAQSVFIEAIWQLVAFQDERVVTALEELSQRPEMRGSRTWIARTIRQVKKSLGSSR